MKRIALLLMACLLAGCSAPAEPMEAPAPTPTIAAPTATATPTPRPTPTPIPVPIVLPEEAADWDALLKRQWSWYGRDAEGYTPSSAAQKGDVFPIDLGMGPLALQEHLYLMRGYEIAEALVALGVPEDAQWLSQMWQDRTNFHVDLWRRYFPVEGKETEIGVLNIRSTNGEWQLLFQDGILTDCLDLDLGDSKGHGEPFRHRFIRAFPLGETTLLVIPAIRDAGTECYHQHLMLYDPATHAIRAWFHGNCYEMMRSLPDTGSYWWRSETTLSDEGGRLKAVSTDRITYRPSGQWPEIEEIPLSEQVSTYWLEP